MAFPQSVSEQALVACGRCCCICHKFCGRHMELHHIHQHADGGEDTFENCIPLCLDCHADMGKSDPRHHIGKQYSEEELRMHRNNWYAKVQSGMPFTNEPSLNEQHFNEMRKKVAEALVLYADRFSNPVDVAQMPDHRLPASYSDASDALRKIGSELIAEAEVLDGDYPISRESLHEAGRNFIGLSNSMSTPYGQGLSKEQMISTRMFVNTIREIFSLSKR